MYYEYIYLMLDIWKIFSAICVILVSFSLINRTKENIKYKILTDFIYFLLFVISICFISVSKF